MEIGKEMGHFRESIILRGARRIDPDAELEQKISVKEEGTQSTTSASHGSKGKEKSREKGKGDGKEKGKGKAAVKQVTIAGKPSSVEEGEGGEAAGVTMSADGSENGQAERSREEDRYGFLYSVSEADQH